MLCQGAGAGGMTAERYYVKRPTGKVFGPFDKNAISLMLKSNKLDLDSEISSDQEHWIALTQVPEFAQAAGRPTDLPSRSGPSDLPSLPKAGGASRDLPSLPRPGGAGPSDLPSLPKPAGLSNDLPKLSSPPNLPRSSQGGAQGIADLPRAVGQSDDLPRAVAQGNDLPKAAGQGHDLPRAAGGNLPRLSAPAGLPSRPSPIVSQPALNEEDDFDLEFDLPPVGGQASRVEEEDLFGSPRAQLQQDDDDDLFGSGPSASDDLFEQSLGNDDDDDLFGGPSPSQGGADDDLFGAPIAHASAAAPQQSFEDDPFAVPLGNPDDDLFGVSGMGAGHSSSAIEDDLFAGSGVGDEDDFLGGDQGFSFLDDKPAVNASGLNVDSWGDDLLGGSPSAASGSWGDDMLSGNATPAAVPSNNAFAQQPVQSSPPPSQPASQAPAAHDPFRPSSTGIKPEQPQSAQSAQTTVEQATQDDKKRGSAVRIGLPILIFLVLGGIGFGLFKFFDKSEGVQSVTTNEPKRFKIELAKLKTANFAELREIISTSKKADMSADAAGKVLVAHALVLAQHPNDEETLKSAKNALTKINSAKDGEAALGKGALDAVTADLDTAKATLEPLLSQDQEIGFFAHVFLGVAAMRAAEKEAPIEAAKDDTPKQDEQPKEAAKDEVASSDADAGGDASADVAPAPKKERAADLAQQWLMKAAKQDATLPMFFMGQLYEQDQSKRNEAIKAYMASLKATETYIPSLVALGRAHYLQGDLNDAIKALEPVSTELAARANPQDKATALHFIGKVYSARSESDAAIQSYTKALEVDTSRIDTLRALAEEYERAQQYKQALQFFTTNKNLGQKDPEVILGIVRAYSGLKQWVQAIAQLEVGEKAFPADARFPEQLGQLNMRRGTFHEAQKAFERAVEIDPTLVSAHASLAQLAWRTEKDFERGEAHVRKLVAHPTKISAAVATEVAEFYRISGRLDFAKKWYAAAIKRDTNYWPARLALARMQLENDQTKDALALLERSRKEGVTDIRLSAYLADAYRQSRMYDRAIDEINRVIEKFPKNPEYIFIRGRIYFDRGNYETALEDFNKAYELDTRYHEAYFYVGRTAFAQGDKGTALKIFRHVLDYQPNEGEFRFYMGQALESEGRLAQALEEYRKTTEVDPGYGLRNPMIYIARGRILAKLGDGREAKKDIARALEIAPEMTEALIAMGEADYREQNYDAAINNFNKALAREPKHPEAQQKLGMSLIYSKRNREGAKHLQLALGYGADDPEIYRTLGFLYKELGQRKEALDAFQAYWKKTADKKIPSGTKREILNQIKELGG